MAISEDRFRDLEKKVDIFKDDQHEKDLVTVKTLERVEVLLEGVTDGVSRKGAIGYGGSTAGILIGIVELFRLILS